jgi:signal recognition particle subunit SRP54
MLDALSGRLQNTFRRLGSRGKISEGDLDEALREVRVALLEADVAFGVVREFIASVRERSLGSDVMQSITPGQQAVGIVHQQLVEVLGGDTPDGVPLERGEGGAPTTILVCGMKGAGKTTLAARLGLHLKGQGLKPLLVATDFERVAATEQLQALGDQIEVPVYAEDDEAPPAQVATRAMAHAKQQGANAIIFDTRGTVAFDDDIADELAALADEVDPTEVLIVVDAMTGQEAVTLAREIDEAIEGTGIVVTKVDSDTRGGAVLSVRAVTGLPVKFITTGEKLDALEAFHPDRFASRVLGMGDVVSLVEKAQETIGERDAKEVERRVRSGQFDLEDFMSQMQQVQQMGSLSNLVDMIPGMSGMKGQHEGTAFAEAVWTQNEAIINSMTPHERQNPDVLDGSRRRRIARGSGTQPADVNRLLNQFKQAKQLMQAMTTGKGAGPLGKMLGL